MKINSRARGHVGRFCRIGPAADCGHSALVRISAGEVAVADMLYAPGEAGTIFTVR